MPNINTTTSIYTSNSKEQTFYNMNKNLFGCLNNDKEESNSKNTTDGNSVSTLQSTNVSSVQKMPGLDMLTSDNITGVMQYIFMKNNNNNPTNPKSSQVNALLDNTKASIDTLKEFNGLHWGVSYTKSAIDVAVTLYIAYVIKNDGFNKLKTKFVGSGEFKKSFVEFLTSKCLLEKEAKDIKNSYLDNIEFIKGTSYIKLNNFILDLNLLNSNNDDVKYYTYERPENYNGTTEQHFKHNTPSHDGIYKIQDTKLYYEVKNGVIIKRDLIDGNNLPPWTNDTKIANSEINKYLKPLNNCLVNFSNDPTTFGVKNKEIRSNFSEKQVKQFKTQAKGYYDTINNKIDTIDITEQYLEGLQSYKGFKWIQEWQPILEQGFNLSEEEKNQLKELIQQELSLKIILFNKILNQSQRNLCEGMELNYHDLSDIAESYGIFQALNIVTEHDKLEFINHSIMLNYHSNNYMQLKRWAIKIPLCVIGIGAAIASIIGACTTGITAASLVSGMLGVVVIAGSVVDLVNNIRLSGGGVYHGINSINSGDPLDWYTDSAEEMFAELLKKYSKKKKHAGKNENDYRKYELWDSTPKSSDIREYFEKHGKKESLDHMKRCGNDLLNKGVLLRNNNLQTL